VFGQIMCTEEADFLSMCPEEANTRSDKNVHPADGCSVRHKFTPSRWIFDQTMCTEQALRFALTP